MDALKPLLEKYWKGLADKAEVRELFGLLTEEEEELRAFLREEYEREAKHNESAVGDGSGKGPDPVLEKIHRLMDLQEAGNNMPSDTLQVIRGGKENSSRRFQQFIKIAAFISGLIAGGWLLIKNVNHFSDGSGKANSAYRESVGATTRPVKKRVANRNPLPEEILLEDGTRVVLYPQSVLYYSQPFDSLRRPVTLEGSAFFKVAGDGKRPFSVSADGVVTTVLGTEFQVGTEPDHAKVRVRLVEGRVLVHGPGNRGGCRDVYLKAGEECTVDRLLGKMDISLFGEGLKKQENKLKGIIDASGALNFSKTPLPVVFRTIGKLYHVEIRWKEPLIHKRLFTGKFYPTDSLEMIIAALCNTNELSYEEKEGIITIIPVK